MDTQQLRDSDGNPAVAAIVAEFWPYDGPHTPETIVSAAAALAELTRHLANATRARATLADAPALSAVLGSLSAAASTLPQVLRQLDGSAEDLATDLDLYDNQGAPSDQTALRVAVECETAAGRAAQLASVLDHAHQFASRLGHRPGASR